MFSKEGDPLSMLLYAIATVPLINCLESSDVIQTWYADDSSCQSKLTSVKAWWNKLNKCGPSVGYFPQGMKYVLITHSNNICEAQKVFRGSGIKIVTGHRLLGYIGESFEKSQSPGHTSVSRSSKCKSNHRIRYAKFKNVRRIMECEN
jgi:hypothetical protein